jgi:two-component system NtrC family sensor kinase
VKFRTQILAALAVVGLVPVLLTGFISVSVNRRELATTIGRSQAVLASEIARSCERFVARSVESVRSSVGMMPLDKLSAAEAGALLRIPAAQLEFARALALVNAKGELLADPALREPAMSAADEQQFLAQVPVRLGFDAGTAMSRPYRNAAGEARVAVALKVSNDRAIAAEIALDEIERVLANVADGASARVVSASGEAIAGADSLTPVEAERSLYAQTKSAQSQIVTRADGREWLLSLAPVPQLGWVAIVGRPGSDAFWGVVSLLLIVGLGLLLTRSLTGPVRELARAADTVAQGKYDVSLAVKGADEFQRLGDAFRSMAAAVQKRDEEIRGWNAELQQRVDAATAELKSAQDQILRTRRLAALGALGAGLAHELNNPLTAITGLLSLLKMELAKDSPERATLQQIHDQAMRMAKIVEGVRKFTESERAQGARFPLSKPVNAALEECSEELQKRNIRLSAEVASKAETQGDAAQIQTVVAHLVRNAAQAMPKGGELTVRIADVAGDALKLSITDTGSGIPPALRERIFDPFFTTKSEGSQVGLGLSISHTIVEAHHGRISVDSVEGRGTTFTVLLPAAAPAAHLS